MPLHYTSAHSSRINKSGVKSPLKRSNAHPLGTRARSTPSRPIKPQTAGHDVADDDPSDPLPDYGLVRTLPWSHSSESIVNQIEQIQLQMFDPMPTERGGMNSTRIAEVLNFRAGLPPIVTTAHVHALSHRATATEREIAQAVQRHELRRIHIPARSAGSNAVGDCLARVDRWVQLVERSDALPTEVRAKYQELLRSYTGSSTIRAGTFAPHEAVALLRAGFLTTASAIHGGAAVTGSRAAAASSATGTLASLASVGSRAASGSLEAVGGSNAVHEAGGGGGSLAHFAAGPRTDGYGTEYMLSLPSTGVYLKLLEAARVHLVSLLGRSRSGEAPMDLLKERWDGVLVTGPRTGRAKEPFGGLLPGKTKKWKQFSGLHFEWVLAECLGSGLIELFETGSVGLGVRTV